MSEVDAFEHFVITPYFVRFNDKTNDRDARLRASPNWLEDRFKLFKKFCLPSVVAQTATNFRWLIYFDENISGEYYSRVAKLVEPYGNIELRLCSRFDGNGLASSIKSTLNAKTKWVLTTRLDNDDGWHKDFVKVLHSQLRFEQREFLNFPVGLIYYLNQVYLFRHPSNAFISFLEPRDDFLTVWCGPHPYLNSVAPIRQLPSFPAFLQAVHSQTRSNKPRGIRVHRMLALNGFEAMSQLFEDATVETDIGIILDNLTSAAKWGARDRSIAIARNAARKIVRSGVGGRRVATFLRLLTGE